MLGPSGTGKSVFLKTLVGLLKPDAGSIWIEGRDLTRLREHDLYEVRKLFGVLFQDGALFGSMNLYDNIAFPLREHTRKSESEVRRIVSEKIELVGLQGAEGKLPGEISGGMRKRAGLARALVLDPEIILFDEPDSGLDPVRTAYLNQLIVDLNAQIEATFLIVTHDINTARTVPDNIGLLYHRHLAMFGPREMLLSRGAGRAPVPQRPAGRPDRHVRGEGRRRAGGRVGQSCRRCRRSRCSSSRATAPCGAPPAGRGVVPRERRRPAARLVPVGQRRRSGVRDSRLAEGWPGEQPRDRGTAAERVAVRPHPRCLPGPAPTAVPDQGVHPAVLVHRLGHDRADGAGLDPVRCGHRPPARDADPPAGGPVLHRRGERAGRHPRGLADRHRAAHRGRGRLRHLR